MKKGAEIKDTVGNRDRIHVVMTFLSLAFLALSAAILIWIVRIQNGRFENRGSRCRAMASGGETENANMVRINMPFRRMITH